MPDKSQTTQIKKERAVLAGLSAASMDPAERSTEVSMEELAALVETAGGEALAMLIQQRPTPDPRCFIGDGKVRELKELIEANDCDLAVFDNELSPSQMRVLGEELGVKVLDRSGLILDIFAQRARTREGQLQVELAQYKYLLPRLTGMWTHLVRQTASGGSSPIGTRGPGETQLETDRRHIRRKIQKLEEELAEVRRVRGTQRRRREKNAMPMVCLVGYTNAGKSTLLNCLTGADIPANDRLFDTLDTTTRRLKIDETTEILLSDTVGFIRKLPTHLIEAFKATLEELSYADVLLHVIDISNPEWESQARIVDELIAQLGAEATPRLRVYNKCDRYVGILPHGEDVVCLSAKSGEGTEALVRKLSEMLDRGKKRLTLHIPYARAGLLDTLQREAVVKHTEYTDEGVVVEAVVPNALFGKVKDFIPGYAEPKEDF
ncbi:MAG: GTPase HflX [Oscillospiraceae bacterium]|nr:GTPase HflX [Oscillospiraceae bacterium]